MPPLLTLHAADLGWPGRTVLRAVSLEVGAGTVTTVAGANGAGKSTLLALVSGTAVPLRGRVTRTTSDIAFVPQSVDIPALPLTVRETVAMGRWRARGIRRLKREDHDEVDRRMRQCGIEELASRGLHELSGGQRQRALLAQGLAQNADLIVLDEPTTALDGSGEGLVAAALRAEADRGAGVVVASHTDLAACSPEVRLVVENEGVRRLP